MMIQNAAERIADESWPAGDYQVMWKLVGRLEWENYLLVDVSDLASSMHRSRESVSRAISRLVEKHVLLRGPKVGRTSSYKLDPSFGWKGTPEGRASMKTKIARKGWTVFEGGADSAEEATEPAPLPGL